MLSSSRVAFTEDLAGSNPRLQTDDQHARQLASELSHALGTYGVSVANINAIAKVDTSVLPK
jgi:hypothetical protein